MLAAELEAAEVPAVSPSGEINIFRPGTHVAIKIWRKKALQGRSVEEPHHELAVMQLLGAPGHRNLVSLLDYMQDEVRVSERSEVEPSAVDYLPRSDFL